MKKNWTSKRGFTLGGFVKLTLLLTLVMTLIMTALPVALEQISYPSRRGEAKESSKAPEKKIPDLKVAAEGGSFTLSNLHLVKAYGSTKLKGVISNDTGRRWKRATFELKAFDDKGNQIKGAEDIIIFQANDVERTESMPIDGDYGVWLEGIPIESISKIQAVLIEGQLPAYGLAGKTTAGRLSGFEMDE